jgi:aminopeptidase N
LVTLSLPNALSCYASDLPVSLSKVMENWTYKPGYPVLQVKRDSDNVVVSQKRFLSAGTPQDDEKWYVPISYTTSTDSDKCLNTSPRAWLTIQDKLTITDVLKDREWIILNNQQTGKLNL